MLQGVVLLILLTNIARYGVVPQLTESALLDQRAQVRAEYLCAHHQFSHDNWGASFKDSPYQWQGENLSANYRTYYEAFHALYDSPTHKANLLSSHYTEMGVGEACGLQVELFGGYLL